MDYMSNDIDSHWVSHTNEESNESNLSKSFNDKSYHPVPKSFQPKKQLFFALHHFMQFLPRFPNDREEGKKNEQHENDLQILPGRSDCLFNAAL